MSAPMSAAIITPSFFVVVLGVALVAYAVTAGADYGGGVWDLLARRPSRPRVRRAIEHAIAPIWEANHVWLIFLVVTLFTVFPRAFAVIATALHVPLSLALIGMVVRGSAFVLRAYGMETAPHRHRWGVAFGIASVVTPVLLGASLAALASGDIRVEQLERGGVVVSGFFVGWTTPFALAVGVFGLALFMMLAAVYLAYDADGADDVEERNWFRRRALVMEVVAGSFSAVVVWRAAVDAPRLFEGLLHAPWALPAQGLVFVLAAVVVVGLLRGHFGVARFAVAAQVAIIVVGFGLAMDGYLILPDVHADDAGARIEVMGPLLPLLLGGAALVLPSLWLLFRLFKTHRS